MGEYNIFNSKTQSHHRACSQKQTDYGSKADWKITVNEMWTIILSPTSSTIETLFVLSGL